MSLIMIKVINNCEEQHNDVLAECSKVISNCEEQHNDVLVECFYRNQ